MTNATGFTKSSTNSSGFGVRNISSDVLLLQNGGFFLLQNGDKLLLGDGELKRTNFTKSSTNATNYG